MEDKLRLPAGSSKVIEIPFTAHPQPSVTWSYNGAKFSESKRVKEETVNNFTSLRMAKVIRDDTGSYKVTLKNEFGECAFTVKVTVIGKFFFKIFVGICIAIYAYGTV